jgi:hypothetical protein
MRFENQGLVACISSVKCRDADNCELYKIWFTDDK